MPVYKELLLDNRWKAKRLEILQRDKYTCHYCKNEKFITAFSSGKFVFDEASYCSFDTHNKSWYLGCKRNDAGIGTAAFLMYEDFKKEFPHIGYYLENENGSCTIIALRRIDGCKLIGNIDFDNPSASEAISKFSVSERGAERKRIEKELSEKIEPWLDHSWEYVFGQNVHHLCYRLGRVPWEYENNDLVTACPCCHEEIHTKGQVPVYDENGQRLVYYTPCHRCHGVGYFPEYNHIENGICFHCNGARYEELI